MKVRPSVKEDVRHKCKVIRRHGKVYVICENPRYKQRQGYEGAPSWPRLIGVDPPRDKRVEVGPPILPAYRDSATKTNETGIGCKYFASRTMAAKSPRFVTC